MPRPITRLALRVLDSDQYRPVALLSIRLAGATSATTLFLTDAGEEVTWGGHVYKPVSMARSEVRDVLSAEAGDQQAVTLTIGNIQGKLAQLLNSIEIEGAEVDYFIHDRGWLEKYPDRTRDAIRLIQGEVRDPVLSGSSLVMQVVGALGLLDLIHAPRRTYATKCGVPFGSTACGVDLNAGGNTTEFEILSGSTRHSVLLDQATFDSLTGGDPNTFLSHGYVSFTTGANALQSRPISKVTTAGGRRVYVRYPFLSDPSPGDTILLRRGCPKTKEACAARHGGSVLNWRGFDAVPSSIKPTLWDGDI